MPKKGRAWNEYPTLFAESLDTFRADLDQLFYRIGPMPRRDALTHRTQFYRFFEKVRDGYKEASPADREHTGLDELYQLVNNLVISAEQEGDLWYVQLRKPFIHDPLHRLSPQMREKITQASKAIKKQVQEEDDAFYFNLLSGGKKEEGHIGGVSSEVESLPGFQEMYGPTPQKKE